MGWLKGRPHVREWQEPDGSLGIRVEIRNTTLGQFFGYEGRYRRVPSQPTKAVAWSEFRRAKLTVPNGNTDTQGYLEGRYRVRVGILADLSAELQYVR